MPHTDLPAEEKFFVNKMNIRISVIKSLAIFYMDVATSSISKGYLPFHIQNTKPLVRQKTWLMRIAFGLVEIKTHAFDTSILKCCNFALYSLCTIHKFYFCRPKKPYSYASSSWNCSFYTLIYVRQFKIFYLLFLLGF